MSRSLIRDVNLTSGRAESASKELREHVPGLLITQGTAVPAVDRDVDGRALAGRLQFVELAWSAGRRPPVRDSRGDEDTGALQSCHVNLTFSLVEP